MLLRFDGASKGNPGIGGSCACIYKDDKLIECCYMYHNKAVTNNIAEYYGLIIGLKMAILHGYSNIFVEGDSKLVIEQVFGKWKCNHQNIIPLNNEVKELKKQFQSIHGRWIPREQNNDADKYSNEAIEKRANSLNLEQLGLTTTQPVKKQQRQLTIMEAFARKTKM